jgi:hypothetical protein
MGFSAFGDPRPKVENGNLRVIKSKDVPTLTRCMFTHNEAVIEDGHAKRGV